MDKALARPAVVRRVSDLIGHTPLLELCHTATGGRLLLKLEQFNPTGTAKIRMARQMVLDAEERGLLRPGGRIIESTSGNTGLGLAVIAAERGYTFTAVVDHHAAADKLRGMKALGAELVHVAEEGDEELATAAREEFAEKLAAESDNAYFTEQHNNMANGEGYRPVAHEIDAALDGRVDILIGAVGTGGGLFGTGGELRKTVPGVRIVGVEPKGSIAFGPPPTATTSPAPALPRAPPSAPWSTTACWTRAPRSATSRRSPPHGSWPAVSASSSAAPRAASCTRR